jgi:glycosyltransferase involved in cell wall biosynthesis
MIQLSAVIITFNEEKNIRRCLDSLKGIADDIVVVDSFSTDRTEKICMEKGVRFVQHGFDGHIEQKTWAITQAKFPYILSLDADEELSDELKKNILEAIMKWEKDGYYMNRLNNYCGQWIRHCGWYPDRKLRLFDSRKGMWGGENPHDRYEMTGGDKMTGFLKGDILHYSYYSVEEHYRQAEKFAGIASQAMHSKGMRTSAVMIYAKTVFKFFRNYIIKLGFLDGKYGFTISRIAAWETYLKYSKLNSLNNA